MNSQTTYVGKPGTSAPKTMATSPIPKPTFKGGSKSQMGCSNPAKGSY